MMEGSQAGGVNSSAEDAALSAGLSIITVVIEPFRPYQELAATLLPHSVQHDDGAHDAAHLQRVWKNAFAIQKVEGGDAEILVAAVLLHDCVAVEKDSPQRALASWLAAEKASGILTKLGWPENRVAAVAHSIESHSYSGGIQPESLEAKILQDADRLDSIGFVGVARCFYTAGRMGSALYETADATGESRALDDKRFALDHFYTKLLKLAGSFQTKTGARLARERDTRLRQFLENFCAEI
jgi:uncharacterized protein